MGNWSVRCVCGCGTSAWWASFVSWAKHDLGLAAVNFMGPGTEDRRSSLLLMWLPRFVCRLLS